MNFRRGKICSSVLAGFIFSCTILLAFEYEKPNKIDLLVIPNIAVNSSTVNLIYNYTVVSTNKSIQDVWTFTILTDEVYSNVRQPNGWRNHKSVQPEMPKMVDWAASWGDLPEGKVIPNHSNIDPSPFNIKPGNSLSRFSFESSSLPGVVTFYSEGFVQPPEVVGEPTEDALPPYEFGDDAFRGTTIGPVAVINTSPNGLIDRLITLKDSMPSYGWITNQGIINGLNVKLNAAKASILKGNNKVAVNQLNAFINELDAQKGKQVNENAWALLKANAEFIIAKL